MISPDDCHLRDFGGDLAASLPLEILEAANASYHGMSPLSDVIRNVYHSNFNYHAAM